MKSRLTILLLSDDGSAPRRLSIARGWLLGLGAALALLLVFTFVAGHRLYTLKSDLIMVSQLRETNQVQKKQLQLLNKNVAKLNHEMLTLRCFNRHLASIAKVDLKKDRDDILAMGGTDEAYDGGRSDVTSQRILTRRLHGQIRQLEDDFNVEEDVSRELLTQLERQRSLSTHTPSVWPCRGWVSSSYGWRISPFSGSNQFHKGMDLTARYGQPVYAPADGLVTYSAPFSTYGNYISINHGYGMVTRYGHLSRMNVKPGDLIRRGQVIAYVGNTGRSTGPHLHYEVLLNGIHVNPYRFMLK